MVCSEESVTDLLHTVFKNV